MHNRRIAIAGGGLAGLSAAYTLARRGANVVVFEELGRVGGRAITDELDGVKVDPGAQLFGSMYDRFLGLAREVGLGDRVVRVPGRDALWREGRAHEVVYGSVTSMVSSGGLPFTTKMRLGATYLPFLKRNAGFFDVHAPEAAAEGGLDRESIEQWGEREIDTAFVQSLVYPQLGAYFGSTPSETSAGFYHILAHYGMDVALFAIQGGVGQVADRLAAEITSAGGEVRLTSPVQAIEIAGGGVSVSTQGRTESFDAAISALPAPILAGLLKGAAPALDSWLREVRYRPALSVVMLLERPVPGRVFGLSFPQRESRFVAAVAAQDHKGVPMESGGRGVLIAFPTPESAPSLIDLESSEILDRMLPELDPAFPGLEDRISSTRVYRWPVGSPTMYPGYLSRLGKFRWNLPEGNLPFAVAGDYLYGPSVEGAVYSGLQAAERLAARLS